MPMVVVRVPAANLSQELAAMRSWLDQNICTPRKFTSTRADSLVTINIEFTDKTDANRFEEAFDQARMPKDQNILLRPENEWMLELSNENSISLVTKGTMARACWCRLRAEEVRTEADGMCSLSAKDTMRIVAETWERLAEDIEQRLCNVSSQRERSSGRRADAGVFRSRLNEREDPAYRMYFIVNDRTHGRQDFRADDDVTAIRIARVLFDACSDICQSFELWHGRREIRAQQPPHSRAKLTDLVEAHQRLAIEMEEALSQSYWFIARSRRLIETLDRAKSKAP